jgi:heme/copper-type cytochrome/quinol oxidase subunit 4
MAYLLKRGRLMKINLPDSNLTPAEKEALRQKHEKTAARERHRHRWFLVGIWLMALVIFVQVAGLHDPLPWYGHLLMLVLAVAVSLLARASIKTIIKVVFLGMWMAYLTVIGFWLIMGTSWFAILGVALILALALDFVQLYRIMTGRTPIE